MNLIFYQQAIHQQSTIKTQNNDYASPCFESGSQCVYMYTVSWHVYSARDAGDIWEFYPDNSETHHRRIYCLTVPEQI